MSGAIFHNQPSISPLHWQERRQILPAAVYALEMTLVHVQSRHDATPRMHRDGRLAAVALELSSSTFVPRSRHPGRHDAARSAMASTNGLEWGAIEVDLAMVWIDQQHLGNLIFTSSPTIDGEDDRKMPHD
jgi:hypothetical protein